MATPWIRGLHGGDGGLGRLSGCATEREAEVSQGLQQSSVVQSVMDKRRVGCALC